MARAMAYFSGRPLTVGSRRGRSDSLRGLGEGVGPRLPRLPGDPSGLPEAAGDLQQQHRSKRMSMRTYVVLYT